MMFYLSRALNIMRASLIVVSPLILAFLVGGWVLESPEREAILLRKQVFRYFPDLRFMSSRTSVGRVAVDDLAEGDEEPQDPVLQAKFLGASVSYDSIKRFDPEGEVENYSLPRINRQDILEDKDQRIPEEFRVPISLQPRVGFWLDVYTRYGSYIHLVHHLKYPWIIFAKIDTAPIYAGSGHKWTKYHRAKSLVEKSRQAIRQSLRRLAQNPSRKNLSAREQSLVEALAPVPGSRRKVYAEAAAMIRTQLGQRDFFRYGIVSASKYMPMMEDIFAKYDLPIELTRLPLVESSFNEDAVSKVGASGIWQFMPSVGRIFLRVGETFDERNSPVKSTEAAAKLLLQNFRILKSWPLAMTAYNHGPGGVIKASKAVKSSDLAVIISKYSSKSFSFASSNFFCEYLAALHGERYQDEIFGQISKYPVLRTEGFRLPKSLKPKDLAGMAGITLEQMRLYNPDLKGPALRRNTALPKGYFVHLPSAVIDNLKVALNDKPKAAPAALAVENLKQNARPVIVSTKSSKIAVARATKPIQIQAKKDVVKPKKVAVALSPKKKFKTLAKAEPPRKTRVNIDFQRPERTEVTFSESEGATVFERHSRDL